jgi:hypothetical protein
MHMQSVIMNEMIFAQILHYVNFNSENWTDICPISDALFYPLLE